MIDFRLNIIITTNYCTIDVGLEDTTVKYQKHIIQLTTGYDIFKEGHAGKGMLERAGRDEFGQLKSYYESVVHEKDKFMQVLRESHEIGIKENEKVIAKAESALDQKDLEIASMRNSYEEMIRNKQACGTALEETIRSRREEICI